MSEETKGLLRGAKFSKRGHQSTIPAAERVIKQIKTLDSVTKISVGVIKRTRTGTPAVGTKIEPTDSGVKLTVRGAGSVQVLYVYTKDRQAVQSCLEGV